VLDGVFADSVLVMRSDDLAPVDLVSLIGTTGLRGQVPVDLTLEHPPTLPTPTPP